MNPPYSAKWSAAAGFLQDERFSDYGVLAPKSKADYAFLLHGLYHLKNNGTMAIVLPHGTGKSKKVLAITNDVKAAEAAGADFAGGKEMLEKITKENWFGFDVIVATPDMMGELGKLGRILGPKGLMPNPKTGTVNPDIAKAVSEIKAGKVAYRVDKQGNINVCIGRASFDAQKLIENFKVLKDAIVKAKPATIKGNYIKNVAVTTTMGPGIKVDFSTF